ncbi:MAG: 30S ribosomal protein S6 [Firmicutes bacterium]|nr:30S ribosomal protein S6 [Bacillota bacterium]
MREYEALFVLNPSLEEEARAALMERLSGVIAGAKGEIAKVDEWGKRRLAYEVQDCREGYYILVDFKASLSAGPELERFFKLNEGVLRHLIVKREES